jgi:two-component system cell cycle sensor histidine kinase/response regulator CckA
MSTIVGDSPELDCWDSSFEGERSHRKLADRIPHMLWMSRPDGFTHYVNQRTLDHLGITLDQVTGWNWLELLHPADVERSRALWIAAVETGNQYRNEYRVRQKDGRYRWYVTHAAPLAESDGSIQSWLGTWTDIDDAKRIQETLQMAQEFQGAILDSLDSHIAVLDEAGVIVAVNQPWRRFADDNGFRGSNHGIGLNYFDACSEQISDGNSLDVAGSIRKVMVGDMASFELEYPCHSPSEQRWFVMTVTPFAWSGPPRVVVKHNNVTTRKVAELALRQSESRFQRAIRGTADGVWEWDLTTNRVWLAPYTQWLLGIAAEANDDAHVETFLSLVHPEDEETLRGMLARHATELTPYDTEVRLFHKEDGYLWFRMRACGFADDSGHSRWIAGSLQNISDQIQAAQAMRHLASIVESTDDAIISKSLDGTIVSWNRGAEKMYGYSRAEAIGRSITMLFSPDRVEEELALADQIMSQSAAEEVVSQRVHRDGRLLEVALSFSPVRDDQGRMTAIAAIHRDVTERNASRRALETQQRQLEHKQRLESVGALAGGIAHEFNNLLQIILGYGRFAMQGLANTDQRFADLESVIGAAERAADLTRQLLQYSRREDLHCKSEDPNQIVQELARMLRPLIGEHISLQFDLRGRLPRIWADAKLVQQALLNLCLNGRDAMPTGGSLLLSARHAHLEVDVVNAYGRVPAGEYVVFGVQDNGSGISENVRAHLFEPFFTSKEVGQGTGLGLAMVYGAVQQHQGAIDVTSEPGQGTSFYIYLPVGDENCPVDDASAATSYDARAKQKGVLIAEDENLVRELAARVLSEAGYRVFLASDGDEAVRLFKEHRHEIDLALLDVMMPKRTGRGVYEAIIQLRADVKALFCTGYSADGSFGDFIRAEHLEVVQKPFDVNTLLNKVSKVLGEGSPCPSA